MLPLTTVDDFVHRHESSSLLLIRRTRLITVGDRAFPVASSRLWNSLPHVVTSAPTLAVFRKRLKTFFSFVRFVTDTPCTDTLFSGLAVLTLGHSK